MYQVTKLSGENQERNFYKILILHRMRGLGFPDASANALTKVIEEKIHAIEFDLRITADRQIVIHHDPHLIKLFDNNLFICDLSLAELKKIPHKNFNDSFILTFAEFCKQVANCDSLKLICIDVKESGFENEIVNMLKENRLLKKSVIISWLPEVLFRIHQIEKTIPLCFSHISPKGIYKFFTKKIIFKFLQSLVQIFNPDLKRVQFYFNEYNDVAENKPTPGFDHEHFVYPHLTGELLKIISESKGWICVPHELTNLKLILHYQNLGIKVCLFTMNTKKDLSKKIALQADLILTDEAKFFITEL